MAVVYTESSGWHTGSRSMGVRAFAHRPLSPVHPPAGHPEERERHPVCVQGTDCAQRERSARTDRPRYYVVFFTTHYTALAEAMERAPEDIAAHLARATQLREQGTLLMAGAFLDRPEEPLSTMAVLTSREAAEEFIRGDPFVVKGMVRDWQIREWANMFA